MQINLKPSPKRGVQARGMTLVEILTVIGIIVVLLAILLPGLRVVRRNGELVKSQGNLRQIFTYWTSYATDNREFVVPSQFDNRDAAYKGKVRAPSPKSVSPLLGPIEFGGTGAPDETAFVGTWTDILWTYADLPPLSLSWGPSNPGPNYYNYRYDSPDRIVYETEPGFNNVFRSTEPMTKVLGGTEFIPFGTGTNSKERGHPGYFAANDYLSAIYDPSDPDSGRWFSRAQIRIPDRSIYLVDSFGGETIADDETGWGDPDSEFDTQVDFRYIGNNALILTFEGGVKTEPEFDDILEIKDRGYRIQGLDKRSP